ncbi:MAG: hypothetical protein RIQ74_1400 [Pseudomonadota bacterium]|jgi:hypothetical protein
MFKINKILQLRVSEALKLAKTIATFFILLSNRLWLISLIFQDQAPLFF